MHPILTDRRRLALYLLVWVLLAILLALLVVDGASARDAVLLMLPPTLVFGFVCLAARYPVRAMPLRAARVWALLATHALAAAVLSGAWLLLLRAWAAVLGLAPAVDPRARVFVVTGALLYLLAVAVQYLFVAVEEAHRVEKRAMEVEVLAREAELKALRAQLDPHFLFNSLNSVSALCGSNPASARTLTTLLAEYLRKSLRYGSAHSITLSEELELASSYLAIERIRFGPRLELEQTIDESIRAFAVPPLLLQPIVENAITHGVGHLLEGGVVRIAAQRDGGRVRITVENRCDPDRPSRTGEGIGLANTRRRIATYYGSAARVEVSEEPERFRVALSLPA
ncbi:MAG TPA: histidine kinase [Thermoanaerobaculia bacterium]|nr:histidine kinase [Thermoanaerobaculia bacterium]